MPADLWQDTKVVFTSPWPVALLATGYASSLALQEGGVDSHVESSLEGRDIFPDDGNIAFGALGNPGTHLGVAGLWYLIGQQTQNEKTYEVGKSLFRALAITDLTTMGAKLAAFDKAPNDEFFAFPSGHTSSTFALASVMHESYGPWVGVPLYGLGVFVAVERLDDEEHRLSDVIMGGVMGLVIGHTVAGRYELKLLGGDIIPYTDPHTGASGIAWHKRF